jgi:hypothetical protein
MPSVIAFSGRGRSRWSLGRPQTGFIGPFWAAAVGIGCLTGIGPVFGLAGPTVAWLLPVPHGTNHWAVVSLVAVLFVVPPLLVEAWWKQRRRRAEEQLLITPGGQAAAAADR